MTTEDREKSLDYFDSVLDLAKAVVEIVCFGFIGQVGELHGKEHPTSGDPERAEAQLLRVLRVAGLAPSAWPPSGS